MRTAIALVERGVVPDALTRAGIRRLCAERLAAEAVGGEERRRALLNSLSRGPGRPGTTAASGARTARAPLRSPTT